MISERELISIFNTPYHRFFENGSPNPAGDLLGIGIGVPKEQNRSHDTRKMWRYPYYTFTILTENSAGSYHNENGLQFKLSAGNFFFTFPDVKQQYGPVIGERWGELYVCFTGKIFDIAYDQGVLTCEKPVWHLHEPGVWIEELIAIAQKNIEPSPQDSFGRAVHFLDYLVRLQEVAEPLAGDEFTSDWFGKACHLLTNDLNHKVDMRSIARELAMSYHTFRLYFKRRSGVSPLLYRDQARIKRACKYLSETPVKSCREIAFVVGYSCPQRFSQQFKLHVGMAPQEYRKQYLLKASAKKEDNFNL